MYTAKIIASYFPEGTHLLSDPDAKISQLCIDSRKAAWQSHAIFIALKGARADGHRYILDAWKHGVRNFLVEDTIDLTEMPEGNYISVPHVLEAFHHMAAEHRKTFSGKVIAIIGSNAKTWVKEWLYMLMHHDLAVYRSPGSYNSQVGVPLSVWNIPLDANFAIIEAGLSKPGEMTKLQKIIRPDIVVFTHFGDAHDEGFDGNKEVKLNEKLIMCSEATSIVFPKDQSTVFRKINESFPAKNHFTWSLQGDGMVNGTEVKMEEGSQVQISIDDKHHTYHIPFSGVVPVSNSLACVTTFLALGIPLAPRLKWMADLRPIDMRLKAEIGIQGCVIINDSYSLDLDSLQYALESLDIAGQSQKKTLILSDHAVGRPHIYEALARMINGAGMDKLVCIGNEVKVLLQLVSPSIEAYAYKDVDEFFRQGGIADFYNEVILLKGARRFGFERIARRLQLKSHSAVLHVDLGALDHNLRYFYSRIHPGVKKIAVVKANAYGAGSMEVCRFLSYQNIDMLAVAVIDEGVELREAGISIPVMVLNPDPDGMENILEFNLEPEVYNAFILKKLLRLCSFRQQQAVIHIKLDTGTHRLGFGREQVSELIELLSDQPWIQVGSIFSHLSASDDPTFDDFTLKQIARFETSYKALTDGLGYTPPRHVLSTAGILRFPQFQFEMVRLGIGLYGVGLPEHKELMPVHSLKARILHIQNIDPGESVSYSRSFITDRSRTIATVNLGYADGLPRVAGDVGCSFLLHGQQAPIIGRVCMDMTMIDVSDIPEAGIGDEVTVFDKTQSLEVLAKACGTIPYEILTHLNPRIRKVYEHG